jgi:deoxyribodipyrimidine photo-lyase
VRTGSPYAVTPGRVTKARRQPLQVFSPFARAWRAHGWRAPAAAPNGAVADRRGRRRSAAGRRPVRRTAPTGGEAAARRGLAPVPRRAAVRLRGRGPARHGRRRAGSRRTSSTAACTPRTLLADLACVDDDGAAVRRFTDELAWREFYADVLWHRPGSAPRSARRPTGRHRGRHRAEADATSRRGRRAGRVSDRRRRDAAAASARPTCTTGCG